MGNKIFCILVVLILMVGCDWGTIKDKSIKISELLRKGKDNAKNQDRIKLDENNSVYENNIFTVDVDVASLEHPKVDLTNYPQQVKDPVILNDKVVTSKARGGVDLINNINFAAINSNPAKPTQNLGNSLGNAGTSSAEFLPIENQKEPSKRIVPSKLEDLESFINVSYEKEAFEGAKATQSLIKNSNIGKEIVKLKEEYSNLYDLFWHMQQKFHNQKDSFIKDVKSRENRKKIELYLNLFHL